MDKRFKHGLWRHPLYARWRVMINRCENPKNKSFRHYGARGITVCDRWHDFPSYLEDVGTPPSARHQLDRIDNDGPYSPENCRWSTIEENNSNRSFSHIIEHEGRRLSCSQWARELGTSPSMIALRAERGWTVEMAVTTPPRNCPPRLLTHNGETLPLCEWARRLGVGWSTIDTRLAKGWSVEDAVTIPSRRPRQVFTFQGETRTLKDWARHICISRDTLYMRIRNGWSIERALTHPKPSSCL